MYPCVVAHTRTTPVAHSFRQRGYLWLVDLDQLPALPRWLAPLARFDPRDHLGGDAPTLRAGLDRLLAERGEPVPDGPVWMLAQARVFGHVFNPLTVYWCHRADGALACVVAEVHNTYGQRHSYLLHPDERGRAEADKEFYVSPFYPVAGRYRMSLPPPGRRLSLTVTLHPPEGAPFVATVRGHRRDATLAHLLALAATRPLSTLAVSLGIRLHGIRLYLRGLPVVPRPPHRPEAPDHSGPVDPPNPTATVPRKGVE
ncbi:DUF1365 domain-containing protein [Streptomyces sp. NPDC005438]|uniref:DUF1365 domain-containing protein n=1 Tax=Streptomyces sp. NPDC005438 TaxID=3156880 RepID=UPI0033AE830E